MGSLLSSPKAPKAAPKRTKAASSASTTPPVTPSQASRETIASEEREQNLLSRNRGRLGTIETGFRGFLSTSTATAGRKNLLGE